MENNKLIVTDEYGKDRTIVVLDIVEKKRLFRKKEFMVYFAEDEPDKIYASYLHETKDSFSLDRVEGRKDTAFANALIDKAIEALLEQQKHQAT